MFQNLFGFEFNLPEFFLGLILGIAVGNLVTRAIPWATQAARWGQAQGGQLTEGVTAGPIDRYRRELIAYLQAIHLARPLFALGDILVTPRVLAPPIPPDPLHAEPRPEDTLGVLPNLPDWNHLSAIYQAPSLSLPEALLTGTNLLLTGEVGSGKTTALAHLAWRVAEDDPGMGGLADYTPFFIHAANLRGERRGRGPRRTPAAWRRR